MSVEDLTSGAVKPLMRVALGVEYDGSQFHGWQAQKFAVASVQAELEAALSKVAAEPISVICAGRTDTGVHASEQVVHFDTHVTRDMRAWILGTNSNLSRHVSVRWATPVSMDFHARFSAVERQYRYVIYNHSVQPALFNRHLTWTHKPLNVERMQQAANYLLGTHDFTSYRAVQCQAKSPVRTLHELSVQRFGDYIVLNVRANAFLHHMVRNLAGVLMKIGAGEAEPTWAREVLQARDRRLGGVTAPPFGLYLVRAGYPEHFLLPQEAPGPSFIKALMG
ncbi:tRNA pseudouridine(38-40) synthase TruA [Balneatrix alpica]|uniref:tRNA pseudouridine synthase A n=1 Tax=Balneatrix alpica TaxID=75684 RepID=A0ABV5Z814_9GAMM|nr:tRNA pseudouridine(38-40) synthase TruA [Balneatrix alpica]